ncbi:hypothetical protein AAIH46_04635 [Rhizobium sp. 0TCS1.26]|uniref:hypothetical protein n=1 Tax=Rhizobium sp. 0TCS1.26 TaxID=3142623 RepID=UPI003D2E09A7
MIGGFSLFGFDLFGLTQRRPASDERADKGGVAEYEADERPDRDRDLRREPADIFFWGMYPVY